jgi:hypothetical protein
MIEWYSKSNAALVEGNFRRSQLQGAVALARAGKGGAGSEALALRGGYTDFQRRCEAAGVPLLVFSAGIANVIEEIFHQFQLPLGGALCLHALEGHCHALQVHSLVHRRAAAVSFVNFWLASV